MEMKKSSFSSEILRYLKPIMNVLKKKKHTKDVLIKKKDILDWQNVTMDLRI